MSQGQQGVVHTVKTVLTPDCTREYRVDGKLRTGQQVTVSAVLLGGGYLTRASRQTTFTCAFLASKCSKGVQRIIIGAAECCAGD